MSFLHPSIPSFFLDHWHTRTHPLGFVRLVHGRGRLLEVHRVLLEALLGLDVLREVGGACGKLAIVLRQKRVTRKAA